MIPTAILSIFGNVFSFIKKNPNIIFAVALAIFVILFFKQCDNVKTLKQEVKNKEIEMQNEQDRYENNIEALKDSVKYYSEDAMYSKGVLRVKEGELEKLDKKLYEYKLEIQRLADLLGEDANVKNIYVTAISSNVDKTDVLTIIKSDSLGNFAIGISDTNQIITINTESWFKLVPDTNELKLKLVNKFDDNASRLRYNLNFSLLISQIELENGKTRVIVQPRDIYGKPIPKEILNIPFVDGVEFMDVEPKTTPLVDNSKKKRRFGVMIGPSYGIYYQSSVFIPTWGLGIMVGYKIL
jgi:hypothetical protein